MKTIEKNVLQAIRERKTRTFGNTSVYCESNFVAVSLHGNNIYRDEDGEIFVNLCGWNTATTRSRLRALGIDICQKNWCAYLNGERINVNGWHKAN